MNVLITGGAGFIGSHLAQGLLDQGHKVEVLDDLSTGRTENLKPLLEQPGYQMTQGSILDVPALEPLVERADLIYHLAAAVGVELVVDRLIYTLETNTSGTQNVIHAAQKYGGKKVILASSSEVYGNSDKIPYREDNDVAVGPTSVGRWGYACSKMLDEFLALAYHKEKGLPVVVLRLFNTVGPRQRGRYGMVVPRFVSQALKNEPITVYGDGAQSRCFTYIDDVVKAAIDIAQVPKAEGQVFNVGSSHETTINQLATTVIETLNSTSEILHLSYKEGYGADFEDIRRRVPDISKIQQYVNFEPTTDLPWIISQVASSQGLEPEGLE
jgi:UDP-glucose 4-epimerase